MPASQESLTTGSASSTQESISTSTGLIGKRGSNSFGWMTFGQNDTCLQIMFGYNNPCSNIDPTNKLHPQTPTASQEQITSGTA